MNPEHNISFTPAAADKVYRLLCDEQDFELNLRAYITGGGCSGFQYGFTFDKTIQEDDLVLEKTVDSSEEDDKEGGEGGSSSHTVKLLIDPLSAQYLEGAEIDFKDDLEGAHFVIKNPNAKTTCGCGSSFSV